MSGAGVRRCCASRRYRRWGVLPEAVSRFLLKRPGVAFELHTVHHEDMVKRLYERETDIVISYEVPRAAAVASRRLGRGEMVARFRTADLPLTRADGS
jgi:DNA-binding transcriptional LysR family regulator